MYTYIQILDIYLHFKIIVLYTIIDILIQKKKRERVGL